MPCRHPCPPPLASQQPRVRTIEPCAFPQREERIDKVLGDNESAELTFCQVLRVLAKYEADLREEREATRRALASGRDPDVASSRYDPAAKKLILTGGVAMKKSVPSKVRRLLEHAEGFDLPASIALSGVPLSRFLLSVVTMRLHAQEAIERAGSSSSSSSSTRAVLQRVAPAAAAPVMAGEGAAARLGGLFKPIKPAASKAVGGMQIGAYRHIDDQSGSREAGPPAAAANDSRRNGTTASDAAASTGVASAVVATRPARVDQGSSTPSITSLTPQPLPGPATVGAAAACAASAAPVSPKRGGGSTTTVEADAAGSSGSSVSTVPPTLTAAAAAGAQLSAAPGGAALGGAAPGGAPAGSAAPAPTPTGSAAPAPAPTGGAASTSAAPGTTEMARVAVADGAIGSSNPEKATPSAQPMALPTADTLATRAFRPAPAEPPAGDADRASAAYAVGASATAGSGGCSTCGEGASCPSTAKDEEEAASAQASALSQRARKLRVSVDVERDDSEDNDAALALEQMPQKLLEILQELELAVEGGLTFTTPAAAPAASKQRKANSSRRTAPEKPTSSHSLLAKCRLRKAAATTTPVPSKSVAAGGTALQSC